MSTKRRFRSQDWFGDRDHIDLTALYLERFMNYGLTPAELMSGKPIIGIAQSGSDLTPCNRIHVQLAERVKDGVRDAGGVPIEFPRIRSLRIDEVQPPRLIATSPISRSSKFCMAIRSTPSCSRRDATRRRRPASWPRARWIFPRSCSRADRVLDGWFEDELVGSGTVIWKSRRRLGAVNSIVAA
jgi:xylonate dehydratase